MSENTNVPTTIIGSMIYVPVCNDCNLPHYGRETKVDRCCCDMSGNFHYEWITATGQPNVSGSTDATV